jgi:hypothetical protein
MDDGQQEMSVNGASHFEWHKKNLNHVVRRTRTASNIKGVMRNG